ncbi:hypothetical protein HD554DRAFT_2330317 [Boletus coccyginus]|nr:hypothetical protein HD554DRAFT_2330317 [Boletus coccyginus]
MFDFLVMLCSPGPNAVSNVTIRCATGGVGGSVSARVSTLKGIEALAGVSPSQCRHSQVGKGTHTWKWSRGSDGSNQSIESPYGIRKNATSSSFQTEQAYHELALIPGLAGWTIIRSSSRTRERRFASDPHPPPLSVYVVSGYGFYHLIFRRTEEKRWEDGNYQFWVIIILHCQTDESHLQSWHISKVTTGPRKRIYLSTYNQWYSIIPACHLFPSMQTFSTISKILRTVTRHILGLTLYDMMQSSHDFRDVKAALSDRIDWSIELLTTPRSIHLSNGGHFFMPCALFFLVMAENIQIHYGRLSPAELKERVENIGYATFAILFAVLDIGFVIVRVAALVALSGSPAIAASLVLVSMSPSIMIPMLTYIARLLKGKEHEPSGEVEIRTARMVEELGTEVS